MAEHTYSKSALSEFFSGCPAKLRWYRLLEKVEMPRYFELGINVHKYMEGKDPEDEEAKALASRLLKWVEKNEVELVEHEFKHEARITPTIYGFGRLDAKAIAKDGKKVLIDWKTASHPWALIRRVHNGTEHIYPDAMTVQGEIAVTDSDWSDELWFVVVPKDGGPIRHHPYKSTPKTKEYLKDLCIIARDAEAADRLPKHIGYRCHRCKWKKPCWNIPGWEKDFNARTRTIVIEGVDPNGITAPDAAGYVQGRLDL